MSPIYIEGIGVLLLILLVAVFSAGEVAVVSTRKSRMKELADDGDRRAGIILHFQNNPEEFLATVHVGIVFSLILASGLGGVMGVEHLAPALAASQTEWVSRWSSWIALGIIVISIGSLVVVVGELVPKSLALRFAERVSLRLAVPFRMFATVFHYPVRLFTMASNLFLAPFKDKTSFTESRISEEEFKLMLDEGTRSGVIDKTENELIRSIFEFTDTTAKEVMIPRPDVVALDLKTSRDKLLQTATEEGYSRMPVYEDSIDNIKGIVYMKDLLGMIEHRNVILLEDVIRPAFFVPETTRINKLLRDLQQRNLHMAIVIDEFGGTEGIVTLEDIIEEIVGEIHDEYDEVSADVEWAADGSFVIGAHMTIREFNQRFDGRIPDTDEYETVGGFLQKLAGGIPEINQEVRHGGFSFSVAKKSQRRIRIIRVRREKELQAKPSADQGRDEEN